MMVCEMLQTSFLSLFPKLRGVTAIVLRQGLTRPRWVPILPRSVKAIYKAFPLCKLSYGIEMTGRREENINKFHANTTPFYSVLWIMVGLGIPGSLEPVPFAHYGEGPSGHVLACPLSCPFSPSRKDSAASWKVELGRS